MRITILAATLLLSGAVQAASVAGSPLLPEFTRDRPADWFNSPPLQRAQLHGKVVLIDVWTFDCWNCYRSFPWLHAVQRQFAGQPFEIIGIHSPEFAHERQPARLAQKIREFKLTNPVMMDADLAYWRALDNHYWPAFYLIDKQGRQRFMHVGETHPDSPQAKAIEAEIRQLLNE